MPEPMVLEFAVTADVAVDLDGIARRVADQGLRGKSYKLERLTVATADVDVQPGPVVTIGRWSARYRATVNMPAS